jgi:hypothetical protein
LRTILSGKQNANCLIQFQYRKTQILYQKNTIKAAQKQRENEGAQYDFQKFKKQQFTDRKDQNNYTLG